MDVRVALRRALVSCALAALAAAGAGCGGSGGDRPGAGTTAATAKPAMDPGVRSTLLATGKTVFDEQCSFCHRLHGRRAPRTPHPDAYGSSFDEIETTEAFVADRVKDGFGGMQSFGGELSPRRIRAVAMYVVANQGQDVTAPPPSDRQLAAGERVFASHCQRCHSIADRPQTHKPLGWQATDFRIVKPSVPFVASVLDGTGNRFMLELMPGLQGKLTRSEIRDVAAYVAALATPGKIAGG
jgi:mono/diheme cytochrome c family protein